MNARTAYEVVMSLSKSERKLLYVLLSGDIELVSKVKSKKPTMTTREADHYILTHVFNCL